MKSSDKLRSITALLTLLNMLEQLGELQQIAILCNRTKHVSGKPLLAPPSDGSLNGLGRLKKNHLMIDPKTGCTLVIASLTQELARLSYSRFSYLMDMAKAEALDAMGEDREALELVERYL